MMLYVFRVDKGEMMIFDMCVALSTVKNLKLTIQRVHKIPAGTIVLLVSGGEMLEDKSQVSFYSAGTDSNPIFMFLNSDIEEKMIQLMGSFEQETNFALQIQRCAELPVEFSTVEKRSLLAQRMYELGREIGEKCEKMVHEQHLQQQGWAAVIANLEDLYYEFRRRTQHCFAIFEKHLESRPKHIDLLNNFGDDLAKLSRIPVLPGLMPLAEADFHGFDESLFEDDSLLQQNNSTESSGEAAGGACAASDEAAVAATDADVANADDEKSGSSTSPNKKQKMGDESTDESPVDIAATVIKTSRTSNGSSANAATTITTTITTTTTTTRRSLNLYEWITTKANQDRLVIMSRECLQGLQAFTRREYDILRSDIENIIIAAAQPEVKEIKGLSERLCKLEELMKKVKANMKEQKDLYTSFQQNHNRVFNVRDASVMPELSRSHQQALNMMLENHRKIFNHYRAIFSAKNELGVNLHTRLKRIVLIEQEMSSKDNRMLFYYKCSRRAESHINIIEQIHQAPGIYVAAVTEVVRRKFFSSGFSGWASKLAVDFDSIHREEVSRRQQFNAEFEGHFLNILFPGMNDMPPAFANETPLLFDTSLPNITQSDIALLSTHLPDFTAQLQLPNMENIKMFFESHVVVGDHDKERAINLAGGVASESGLQHPRLSELQREGGGSGAGAAAASTGCDESETDTETEFEKVPATEQTTTVATSTSEKLSNIETEERSVPPSALIIMHSAETLTEENENSSYAEIERLRNVLTSMSNLSANCVRLSRSDLQNFRSDMQTLRDELQGDLERLHEKWNETCMQSEQLQENLQKANALQRERNHEVIALKQKAIADNEVMEANRFALEELQYQMKMVEIEKDRAVEEACEQLIRKHKTEIESLRFRYKLMTSMEQSPSDANMDRPASSSSDYNVIDRIEHENIIAQMRAAFDAEKEKAIAAAVEAENNFWQAKMVSVGSESVMANVGILNMLEEKERQLEQLREKDLIVTKENYQLKTRLDALMNEENSSWLKEKMEFITRENTRLTEQLSMFKSSKVEQGAIPRSKSSSSSHKYVVLDSCSKGDIVFAVWSVRHGQFMIVQDSPSLFFVHADSLVGLNLRLPKEGGAVVQSADSSEIVIPMPFFAIGRVTDKEYCQARKDENRYRVNRGSKFYRIKLASVSCKALQRRERMELCSQSFSRSVSQGETHSESSAVAPPLHNVSASFISLTYAGAAGIDAAAPDIAGGDVKIMSDMAASTATVMAKDDVDYCNEAAAGATTTECVSVAASSNTSSGTMIATADIAESNTMATLSSSTNATATVPFTMVDDNNVMITSTTTDFSSSPMKITAWQHSILGSSDDSFKERTISITSVAEEEDEPDSLQLDERCRYISVSEEEEPFTSSIVHGGKIGDNIDDDDDNAGASGGGDAQHLVESQQEKQQDLQQQSVITEQPTATNKLEFEFLLAAAASANAPQSQTEQEEELTTATVSNTLNLSSIMSSAIDLRSVALSTSKDGADSHSSPTPTPLPPNASVATVTTASEDSDEYRSLEGKDDTDFPVSE